METTKLPNKKGAENNSFPTGLVTAVIIAIIGVTKYNKFIKFIDSVRFRIVLVQNNQQAITTFISPLSCLNIPYKIENIELFLDNHIWKVQGCELHKKIVASSHIPIVLKAIATSNKTPNESIMAVTYSFCGFTFKRGYQPEILRNENEQRPTSFQQVSRPGTEQKPCSCKNKHAS
ncbi:hypothetical protein PG911_08885 [Tenacibaculum ovolyticum]|uniref:hypothetical protein n=1 Tax=Tenacibaculum ovolyticum TaxID=104270 RepID=UPI0022F3BCBB|nr:hypothetical protein [Tenacibaculum ovolyticum]WBX78361.1 hypothetical protein PG911_08885 [Tenacibaculum ovolyticum]